MTHLKRYLQRLENQTQSLNDDVFLSAITHFDDTLIFGISEELILGSKELFGAEKTTELFSEFSIDDKRFKIQIQRNLAHQRTLEILIKPARLTDYEKPRAYHFDVGSGHSFYDVVVYTSGLQIRDRELANVLLTDLITTHDSFIAERMVSILGTRFGVFADRLYQKLRILGRKVTSNSGFMFAILVDGMDVPIYDREILRTYLDAGRTRSSDFGRSMNETVEECVRPVAADTTPLGNELKSNELARRATWDFDIAEFQPSFGEALEVVHTKSLSALKLFQQTHHTLCLYFPSEFEAFVELNIRPHASEFEDIYKSHTGIISNLKRRIKDGSSELKSTDISRHAGAFVAGYIEAISKN